MLVFKQFLKAHCSIDKFCNKLVFVSGKPFQPSLMFADKARVYPSEAPFRCSALGWAHGLNHKH